MIRPLAVCVIPLGLIACSSTDPVEKPEARYQGAHSASQEAGSFEIPTLTPLENGNIVVRFKKTGCSVLFDHDGKLLEGGRHCDDVDLHRAREEVKAHIAERKADFHGL